MKALQLYQEQFNEYLVQQDFQRSPSELYEPIRYIMGLGGKRLRPILTMISYNIYKNDFQPVLPIAYAVELFHNFSLVHDDIMDEAPLRRGKPALHCKFGANAGILSGDVMMIYCYEYLLQAQQNDILSSLINAFNKVAIDVCEGQQYDMNFEKLLDVSIGQYIQMIKLKTAALIGTSLELGAIMARAPEKDINHLGNFGRYIGIAFQLQDDILDTFGDPEKFGKKVGGDIAQNKKTYLILKALEVAAPQIKNRLIELYSSPTINEIQKIEEVTAIFTYLGIPSLARKEKERYIQIAFEELEQVAASPNQKQNLIDLANFLINREN